MKTLRLRIVALAFVLYLWLGRKLHLVHYAAGIVEDGQPVDWDKVVNNQGLSSPG